MSMQQSAADEIKFIYNGVYIGSPIKYTVETEPIFNDLNTVMFNKHTYTIDAIISGDEDYVKKNIPKEVGEEANSYHLYDFYNRDFYDNTSAFPYDGRTGKTLALLKDKLMESRRDLHILDSGHGWARVLGGPINTGSNTVQYGSLSGQGFTNLGEDGFKNPDISNKYREFDDEIWGWSDVANTANVSRESEWNRIRERSKGRGGPTGGDIPSYFHSDLNMGPIPKILRFEPIGGNRSCRIVYEISFHTKECFLWVGFPEGQGDGPHGEASGSLGVPVAWDYILNYEIDEDNITTRTIDGELKITQNTVIAPDYPPNQANTEFPWNDGYGQEYLAINVDKYRDTILFQFESPENWRRLKKSFKISKDRSKIEFSIVDKEINGDEAFPAKVQDIEVTQTTSGLGPGAAMGGSKGGAFKEWSNSLNCEITLNQGESYITAWQIFAQIVYAKLADGLVKVRQKSKDPDDGFTYTLWETPLLPAEIRISEKKFTNKKRFSFSFRWSLVVDSPHDMFERTGLFQSISSKMGNLWSVWKSHKRLNDIAARGKAGLRDESPAEPAAANTSCWNRNMLKDSYGNVGLPMPHHMNWMKGKSSNPIYDHGPPGPQHPFDFSIFQATTEELTEQSSIVQMKTKITLDENSNSYSYIQPDSHFGGGSGDPPPFGDDGDNGYGDNQNKNEYIEPYYPGAITKKNWPPNVKDYQDKIEPSIDETQVGRYSGGSSEEFRDLNAGEGERTIRRGTPDIHAIVQMMIIRMGGPKPPPTVYGIGGVPATLVKSEYSNEIIAQADDDSALHLCQVNQLYKLTGTPSNLSITAAGFPNNRPQ